MWPLPWQYIEGTRGDPGDGVSLVREQSTAQLTVRSEKGNRAGAKRFDQVLSDGMGVSIYLRRAAA